LSKNTIKLQAGVNIGQASAENDDEFLFDSFVENPIMSYFSRGAIEKNFILGRTGSGKTAILRIIQRSNAGSVEIDVYELSMTYIANSDIFAFLNSINADLSLFFQYLWRHVLLSRYIQERFNVDSEGSGNNFISALRNRFISDKKKNRALKYIEDWRDKLWVDTDEIVKEVAQRTERQLEGEMGGEFSKFRVRGGLGYKVSSEKRAELQRRVKNIINPEQLQDTSKVLAALKEYEGGSKYNDVHILIDKIDENWVDESVRFQVIRGLIEAVRVFRGVKNCHIAVALRTDVYERVVQETADIGFQRDKYEDYFSRIKWQKKELKAIVNKRINSLFRRRYTKDNVFIEDVFTNNVGQLEPFDYMLQRTLYRPRDIIDFVNICLARSVGQGTVTARDVREAEGEYSARRRDALLAEWKAALPSLGILLKLLVGRRSRFQVGELRDAIGGDKFLLEIMSLEDSGYDPVHQAIQEYMNEKSAIGIDHIIKIVVSELYRVGAVGVKNQASERHYYSHLDAPIMSPSLIGESSRVHVHEMLHRALEISLN
tara:strand:+ start:436 stop:2067 length:1632 start_codon:yes stop_codon:yes gene_type:complete